MQGQGPSLRVPGQGLDLQGQGFDSQGQGQGQGLDLQGQRQGQGFKFGPKGVLKDKDKEFTYSYLLQVAAKPTIAIKQQ